MQGYCWLKHSSTGHEAQDNREAGEGQRCSRRSAVLVIALLESIVPVCFREAGEVCKKGADGDEASRDRPGGDDADSADSSDSAGSGDDAAASLGGDSEEKQLTRATLRERRGANFEALQHLAHPCSPQPE